MENTSLINTEPTESFNGCVGEMAIQSEIPWQMKNRQKMISRLTMLCFDYQSACFEHFPKSELILKIKLVKVSMHRSCLDFSSFLTSSLHDFIVFPYHCEK